LPKLDSIAETIESLLPRLPTSTIEDSYIYQQAKALYDQKDMLTVQAEKELEGIKTYEPNLEAEIERCRSNAQKIRQKNSKIKTIKTNEKIVSAENLQNKQLLRAEEFYKEMSAITEKAERIINEAKSRSCPPYTPRQEEPFLSNPIEPTLSFSSFEQPIQDFSFDPPYSTETILNDLLKLGPINKIS